MAMYRWTPAKLTAAVVLWLMAWAAAIPAWGEGRYCVVDEWGTGEGLLPQSSVISMAQTHDGYLWLGTLNGLARFDGVHFTVFDESTTPQLSSIQIVKLFEDSRSNLWIGTESAGAMLVTNGQIFKLNLGEGRRRGHLVSICEDSLGAVWMLTQDRELARYFRGSVDVWNLAGDQVTEGRSVIAEKSGQIWVATDHELVGIDPTKVQTQQPLPEAVSAPMEHVDYLLASRNGGYWRLADGMIEKCAGSTVVTNFGAYPWDVGPIRSACEDRDGNLVVGLLNQGVFWFDAKGRATRICDTNGLAKNSVLSLVMDSDGSLWVGLDGGGLNRVTHSIFNVLDSTVGEIVQSICEDGKGGLWFSPKDHDFCYWKDGVTTAVPGTSGSLSLYNPDAILVDSNRDVWGGTLGVNLYRLANGSFAPVENVNLLSPQISALYQGHGGKLWVGTSGGLECWDGQSWQVFNTNNGLTANIVRAIADDASGNVWIGTEQGGLDLLRGGKVIAFQKDSGFPSDNISCLYLDSDGVLWIGTVGNGLIRMAGGRWKHYTTQNGLSGNSIDYIIEDREGYLWIGSNAGLMRISKRELNEFDPASLESLSCRSYDQKDGLPATECTYGSQPAACRAASGMLWFPTIGGMVSVNPVDIRPNTNPPPVRIEAVLVDQQAQNTNGLLSPPPESITIPAGRESLEIQFASLNPAAGRRVVFRYQLEGYQTKMTPAGRNRFARYPNLPHGEYRFHVEARNEDGIWNEAGASLDVIVLPPFWETVWFRTLVVCLLLGAIVGIVYFISTQKLQRQLAGMRQQQMLEKERSRIARDIHDQVGARLTQLSLLSEMIQADKEDPGEVETHAQQISQAARETAHELDEIVWTVNPSNDTLDGLVNYICKNAQDYLSVAGLRYRLDVPAQLPPIPITPEARHNIFLAAKESVTNVVKHAKASEAWLRLKLASDHFILEVEDNGRGPGGTKEAAAQTRNGLRNMRKRMEDIGGEFFIGPGQQGGTLVRLIVPLRR